MGMIRRLRNDESGQDLIEYALLAGFAVVAAPAIWGTQYMGQFGNVLRKISEVLIESIA